MIVDLLMANPFQLKETLDAVTWRWCFSDLDGPECVKLIDWVGPLYWPKKSYEAKRDEVGWLADGRTGERSQEAIIMILKTCTPDEVRRIDDEVGGRLGLSFDLDGVEQDEFDKLKAGT
jgi:hypothetical protein